MRQSNSKASRIVTTSRSNPIASRNPVKIYSMSFLCPELYSPKAILNSVAHGSALNALAKHMSHQLALPSLGLKTARSEYNGGLCKGGT